MLKSAVNSKLLHAVLIQERVGVYNAQSMDFVDMLKLTCFREPDMIVLVDLKIMYGRRRESHTIQGPFHDEQKFTSHAHCSIARYVRSALTLHNVAASACGTL